MEKYNFEDVTFLIPIRIESIMRLENLLLTVSFLKQYFICKIKILETDKYNNKIVDTLINDVDYLFVEDYDPIFHRTKILNRMVKESTTPYIAIWDTDVIIPPSQMYKCLENLRKNRSQIAFPYDGTFLDTSFIIREQYMINKDYTYLERNRNKMMAIYGKDCKGGAFFADRKAYIKAGMENEKFYGWGPEDSERYIRWETLGYKIFRSEGCLFHLSHTRGINSSYRSLEQNGNTSLERFLTYSSSKQEILDRIKKGYYSSK